MADGDIKSAGEAASIAGVKLPNATPSRQDGLREALRHLVRSVDDLIAESEGVYGLHLNGDPAPWSELVEGGRFEGWLVELERARAALSDTPPPDKTPSAPDVRRIAVMVANIRQGRSSTPRCEPPGECDIRIAEQMVKDVLQALSAFNNGGK